MNCQNSPTVRLATFNIWELTSEKLAAAATGAMDEQLAAATSIIQQVRPDILVINEIDHDYNHPADLARNARLFRDNCLQKGENPLDYPYVFAAPCNTGIRANVDLDNDGLIADPTQEKTRAHGNDCFGYGEYPGQYSMALLSKHPIDDANVRTFQKFLWQDLPGNHIPPDFYAPAELAIFRLSSKSHWDVPVTINGKRLHLFVSHPTPPVFDGPEDRNGRRNFDEIKFWVHYLDNDAALYDDAGKRGGFNGDEPFIIAGDLNAAPDADAVYDHCNAISQLLDHPKIQDTAHVTVHRNLAHPPATHETHTAQFSNQKIRVDYVLPGKNVQVIDGGVFWPYQATDPAGFDLAEEASDHRLVWIDIRL